MSNNLTVKEEKPPWSWENTNDNILTYAKY